MLVPQLFPAQAATLSGVQQVVPVQTCPIAHCAGQPTIWPQLFVTTTPPHRLLHAAPLFGVQQVPPAWQRSPLCAQEPLTPQAIVCPQLFTVVAQAFPAHVVVSGVGTHPHAFDVHVSPPSQPPQPCVVPQLFVVLSHLFVHQPASGTHLH